MRKIISAMNVSLDGFIEGADGELDWIENWEDSYGLMDQVDTCVLGAGMYPGYEQFWSAVLAAPDAPLPLPASRPPKARSTTPGGLNEPRISCCRSQ